MRKRKYTALSRDAVASSGDDVPVALIHNIVATTQIYSSVQPIRLQHIANVMPNSYYDRCKFAAITIRMQEPTCTALLFTSGKLVLTGCKGWNECILASIGIVTMLKRYIPNVDFHVIDSSIQNIVGHVEIGGQSDVVLDLDRMYEVYCTHCTYQKTLFPGLIYRPDNSPIVLLCFYSGKIVVTGGKCVDDITVGWARLWPTIKQFIRP